MSLQSTYQSRKALLVENLETMGVTGYDETDGLTTLINAVLEIGPTPPTPTPASIDLTGTKSILSYADSEQCVLTATVLDENDDPVEGVDVNLYNGATLWDTLTTDSSGECSKTYSSAGSGDITFTAEVDGTLLTKTYDIEDCLLYQDMTKIKSDWTKDTSVTGRTIYKLTPNYQSDVELTFKLKGTIPSTFIVGFGETGGSPAYWNKLAFFRYNDVLYAVADNSNNISLSNPSISTNTIFKFTTSNLHSITGYLDDVSKIARTTNSGHGLNLRIDDFGGLDIDYLKVKPL